ncbi:MAG: hypothetical protein JO112_08385 [Planctomycetes bacterium]|nr:hypothetical protein [Planctomycetota bacterium]
MRVVQAALVLGVAACLATPTLAQKMVGEGTGFSSPVMFLQNEGVLKELRVSNEQMENFRKVGEGLRDQYKEKFHHASAIKNLSDRRLKFQELIQKASEDADHALAELLQPDQLKRLQQIALQMRGAEAFHEAEIQKDLKLTDNQKSQIQSIREQAAQQLRNIFQATNGNYVEARKKLTALRQETVARVVALLNPDQKQTWEDLTGKPFEFRYELNRSVKDLAKPANNSGTPPEKPQQ